MEPQTKATTIPINPILEIETSVLGALILESSSHTIVKDLKPFDFSLVTHRTIFSAIQSMIAEGNPVDMRTLVYELKKIGQLENIGGAHYIAALTSSVYSAANLAYHSKILREGFLKREAKQVAIDLAEAAGDDSIDILETWSRLKDSVDHIYQSNFSPPDIISLKSFMIDQEPPEEIALIKIGNSPIATPGNHSLVIGKKKSRKTLFLGWILSQYNGNIDTDVLYFDTEQGKWHVWKTRDRIQRLTGKEVTTFYLRGQSPEERKRIIEHAIKKNPTPPKLIIIDGIRDLISNINDPDQSTELITWIERITLQHKVHIVNVLHQNKTDGNARGHIGSELLNKAEVTIELELDEKAGCTVVKCESSRDIPFESFAFTHNSEGLPEIVNTPIKGKTMTEADQRLRLKQAFDGESAKYADAIEGIKTAFGVGENRAGSLLAEFQRRGLVVKNGRDRSPETVYKLMID